MSTHETLGLLLVRDGVITRPQLYDALRLQRQNSRLLGTCLLTLGYVSGDKLLAILARQLAIPALPPGTLGSASVEAIKRVPGEVAVRLRIVPYSYDNEMLGVAVADGRALNHLHEVAFHAQAAVGAYVALESEIEAVLRQIYPHEARRLSEPPPRAEPNRERPRPARVAPVGEVPSLNFGEALGLDGEPVILETPKGEQLIRAAPPRAALRGPPPKARRVLELKRLGLYDAVEQIYAVKTPEAVATLVGRAVLNYFSRAVILAAQDGALAAMAAGGVKAQASVPAAEVPATWQNLGERSIAYGPWSQDPRAAEICAGLGLGQAATALIAPIVSPKAVHFLVYADNGAAQDLYEDLHDVELLFKEAETALGMFSSA